MKRASVALAALLLSLGAAAPAWATSTGTLAHDLTASWVGWACLAIFAAAYLLVMAEEALHLRKSIPVLIGAGAIWAIIGFAAAGLGDSHAAETAVRHYLLEFGELFLFLLAAMTFVNTMDERGVFQALRAWLVSRGFTLRALFWLTGVLAFFISPVADNLTTALLMGAVVLTVGTGYPRFQAVACISVVVAANAGGAFSPFGDITTLMVWQKGIVPFADFFRLFVPSLVNWLVPAVIMATVVEKGRPEAVRVEIRMKPGAIPVMLMFLATVATAVAFHGVLGLPPVLGMIGGLGALKLYGHMLTRGGGVDEPDDVFTHAPTDASHDEHFGLDIFKILEKAEWDTLMFFCGVILCVGGLGTLGYLAQASAVTYTALGDTTANVLVGVVSAVIDNIPVMVAVLAMEPAMSLGQWLLVTLTAGVGGSMLSIGSAAGVALMGQARGVYTFGAHLRWSWAILLGYGASIVTHFWVNGHLFK